MEFRVPRFPVLVAALTLTALAAGRADAQPPRAAASGPVKPKLDENYVPDEFFVDVPRLMVSVPADASRSRMMIVEMMVATTKPEYRDYLNRMMPRVVDAIQVGLQNGTASQYDAPEGAKHIKANIIDRVRNATNSEVVTDILIKTHRVY